MKAETPLGRVRTRKGEKDCGWLAVQAINCHVLCVSKLRINLVYSFVAVHMHAWKQIIIITIIHDQSVS